MKTYNLSKDYEKLYNLLCKGHVIACFVDYFYTGDPEVYRDICKAVRRRGYDITFQARGIQYGSVSEWHNRMGTEENERSFWNN